MSLKEKQEKFCQSYIISKNATRAAIEAGYSEKSAHNQGWRLLQETPIKERLLELEGELSTDVDVVAELERQYEQAKANGAGQTALKALELLSRVRGNNSQEEGPEDIESLEGRICTAMSIIGKDKMYELFIDTFPEDFEEDESEEELTDASISD